MKAVVQFLKAGSRKFKGAQWLDDEQILFEMKDESYRLADDKGMLYLFRESEKQSELICRFQGEKACVDYLTTFKETPVNP